MKRLIPLFPIVLFCISAAVYQPHRRSAFRIVPVAAALTPTNLPNATSISWWKGTDYTTNVDYTIIPDSGPGGYALTNRGANSFWMTYGGTLSGYILVSNVPTASYLCSQTYTSAQPHTVCAVIHLDEGPNANVYFMDSFNSSYRTFFYDVGIIDPKQFTMYAGGAADFYLRTNTWFLLEVVFNGANSRVWTNGVAAGAAQDAGAGGIGGITFFSSFTLAGNGLEGKFSEIMTYRSAFTAADRNYLSNYVRDKYGAGTVVP